MFNYIVKEKSLLTRNILLLTLQPERMSEQMTFYPGQYAAISFYVGSRLSPTRCFSIVSSPRERNLQFAIRIGGHFTQKISNLEVGDHVKVTGPYGQFTVDPEYDNSLVFLAGGIGITPFMSILRYATEIQLNKPIRLLFSNRNQDEIPFKDELISLEKQNPNLKIAFYVTDGAIRPTTGVHILGKPIDQNDLTNVTNNWADGITYFLCGPSGFRKNFETIISEHILDPDRLVSESFTQVTKLSITSRFSIPTLTYSLTAMALLFGTGFIMSLDLARSVPKLVSSQNPTSTSSTSQTSNTSTNNTSTSTTNQTTTTVVPTQTYYQPVTRVS